MDTGRLRRSFERYLTEKDEWMSLQRLDYSLGRLSRGTNLRGTSVLDIGAGDGFGCVWCLIAGAKHVVAVEPEASGSTGGVSAAFREMAASIGIEHAVTYCSCTLDQYYDQADSGSFDIVYMKAVINHLDEEATSRLHLPEANPERQRYRDAFHKIFNLLKPGGTLLIYDVGRRNLWHDLHVTNPMGPTLDFRIHQQPGTWRTLLEQCGFVNGRVGWFTPYRLRHFRFLFSNALGAYLVTSAFTLSCRRPDHSSSAADLGSVRMGR